MLSHRDSYLAAIRRLAYRHGVSEEMCEAFLTEITAHIDATIQARIETGETLWEAEANAITGFGDPKRVVAKLAEVHRPKPPLIYRPFLLSAFVLFIVYIFAFLGASGFWGYTILFFLLLALAWFMVESYRGKRLQVLALAALAAPAWIAIAVAISVPGVANYGFAASYNPNGIQLLSKTISVNRAYVANLETSLADFKRKGDLRVPRDFDKETGAIVWRKARDAEFAARSWQMVARDIPRQRDQIVEMQNQLDDAVAMAARPWLLNIPRELGPSASVVWQLLAAMLGLNGFVVFMGWLVAEISRTIQSRIRRSTLSSVLPNSLLQTEANWEYLAIRSHPAQNGETTGEQERD